MEESNAWIGNWPVTVQIHQLRHTIRVMERVLARQQRVVGGAKGVDVAARIQRPGLALLGTHEERRADDRAGLRAGCCPAPALARPKSATLIEPSLVCIKLAGLMSR